jgi:hypothetical protein
VIAPQTRLPISDVMAPRRRRRWPVAALATLMLSMPVAVEAHDPVFGLGPHTLFKGGTELHLVFDQDRTGGVSTGDRAFAFARGITSDWTIGIEREGGASALRTKYRFWRDDRPQAQSSVALIAGFVDGDVSDRTQVALAYGYESLRWYRWASVGYQAATGGAPDVLRVDLVGGIRFRVNDYREPDAVWMLELNGELPRGAAAPERWFLSPGLMWTVRNFALKVGVQIPIVGGDRAPAVDFRALIELEWHM